LIFNSLQQSHDALVKRVHVLSERERKQIILNSELQRKNEKLTKQVNEILRVLNHEN